MTKFNELTLPSRKNYDLRGKTMSPVGVTKIYYQLANSWVLTQGIVDN